MICSAYTLEIIARAKVHIQGLKCNSSYNKEFEKRHKFNYLVRAITSWYKKISNHIQKHFN